MIILTSSRRGKAKDSLALSTQHLHELVAFMYDHFDEFKLILCRAEGTGYADFIEVLVELEVDRSEEYYALLRKNGMLSGSMTRQLHHMITRAYFTAVCETIVHDMPREEAMKYVDELAIFFPLRLERTFKARMSLKKNNCRLVVSNRCGASSNKPIYFKKGTRNMSKQKKKAAAGAGQAAGICRRA